MPISVEHADRTYPPASIYRVGRTKITELARAIQDENSAHFGDHPIAPSTFVAVIAAQARDPLFGGEELGLALHRTVHADQTFDFHRPLRKGDDVVIRFIIEQARNCGNLDMVTILVALTVDGEAVCDIRSIPMHTREEAPHD